VQLEQPSVDAASTSARAQKAFLRPGRRMGPEYYETAVDATAWYAHESMADVVVEASPTDRGAPLVATWARWATCSAVVAAVFVGFVEAFLAIAHSSRTLASFVVVLTGAIAIEALLVFAILHSEESLVARELRTARTGTAAARGMVIGRRTQSPFFARLFAAKLGAAAVLLAEGDRDAAIDALNGRSALVRGGRLDRLRDLVEADAERASGTSAGLERCVQRLRAAPPVGNREADLYRTHVLVKALLEQGDGEGALELLEELERSPDDEQQVYVAWLRVWFELDADGPESGAESAGTERTWPALPEGRLRVAMLLARAHGAEKLVEKLEARVSSIARAGHQG
jgi:hypothetical protein